MEKSLKEIIQQYMEDNPIDNKPMSMAEFARRCGVVYITIVRIFNSKSRPSRLTDTVVRRFIADEKAKQQP